MHCNVNSLQIRQCAKGGVGEFVPRAWGVLSGHDDKSRRAEGGLAPIAEVRWHFQS